MRVAIAVTLLSCALAGCTEMRWQRADGGPVYGYHFDRAMAHCRGWSGGSPEAMQHCMARHGFVWGPA